MKLFERLRSIVLDPSRNLRERVFLALTVAVISIVCLALLGDIIYGENSDVFFRISVLCFDILLKRYKACHGGNECSKAAYIGSNDKIRNVRGKKGTTTTSF